jgi:hypothetical protein
MAKTWVLDTETKGTGAHVAPLSEKQAARRAERDLAVVQLQRPPRPPRAEDDPTRTDSRRFKLVDVRAGRVLGEELDTRRVAAGLARMSSPLDARVFVWQPERERWHLLGLAQTRTLWQLGQRAESARGPEPEREP